ncbi:hypothetical protein LguiB_009010 [Lonicera macranthoides]
MVVSIICTGIIWTTDQDRLNVQVEIMEHFKEITKDMYMNLTKLETHERSNNCHVMALAQTQLDEALKLAWCDSYGVSLGGQTSVSEHLTSPFILTNNKSISSEKIQSGAITSSKVYPPSSCVILDVIETPGSFQFDLQMFHNLSQAESDSSMLFGKEKLPNEFFFHLEDCEASTSAVATTTPFISTPGGITGVQACQHMVVYNHYGRLGQFEHVRSIFIGTMYGILTMASPLSMFNFRSKSDEAINNEPSISPLCALDDEER